jgi:hypothetical protein
MNYPETKTAVTVRPWLKMADPDRGDRICGVTAHSSRGPTTMALQGQAVENWMANASNGSAAQGWGSSCDVVIFATGDRRVMLNYRKERPLYGAGYGNAGSWDMGAIHLQVELAQPDNDTPFTFACIDSFAEFCAAAAIEFNFPLVRLPFINQTEQPFPRGISSHDATMNGRKLGKTDVGKMFPWPQFMELASGYYAAMSTPPAPPQPQIDALKEELDGSWDALHRAMKEHTTAADHLSTVYRILRERGIIEG